MLKKVRLSALSVLIFLIFSSNASAYLQTFETDAANAQEFIDLYPDFSAPVFNSYGGSVRVDDGSLRMFSSRGSLNTRIDGFYGDITISLDLTQSSLSPMYSSVGLTIGQYLIQFYPGSNYGSFNISGSDITTTGGVAGFRTYEGTFYHMSVSIDAGTNECLLMISDDSGHAFTSSTFILPSYAGGDDIGLYKNSSWNPSIGSYAYSTGYFDNFQILGGTASVPVPSAFILLGTGVLCLAGLRRKQKIELIVR